MAEKWNGKLVDSDRNGEALVGIVMEYMAAPCAFTATIFGIGWLYVGGMEWFYYPLVLIIGPITGLFLAGMVAFGVVACIVLLLAASAPFWFTYNRLKHDYPGP